jgi:hypothetical protein
MRFDGKQFTNQTIRVDENEFVNCKFVECRLIFTGAGSASFQSCLFERCEWIFDGAAENTIQYLAAMYNGLGLGGRDIVEGIFESIRQGGVGHGSLVSTASPALHR